MERPRSLSEQPSDDDNEEEVHPKPKQPKAAPFDFLTDSSGNVIPIRSRRDAARASGEIREGEEKR